MSRTPDFRKNKSIIDVIVEKGRPPRMSETGWYRVSVTENYESSGSGGIFIGSTLAVFKSSWANLGGATNPPASWYMSEGGEVRMRGKITGGVAGTTVFVLPEEVRPEYAETFICPTDTGGKANITVWPDGRVIVDSIGT